MDKQFYQGLLDQISDGVYFVTLDRRITYWNGGAERITGYAADEVLGRSCSEGILRHVDDAGRQLCLDGCPLAAVMKDGKPREAHVYLHHKDGHRVPVTVRGQALRNPDEDSVEQVLKLREVPRAAAEEGEALTLVGDQGPDSVHVPDVMPVRRHVVRRLARFRVALIGQVGVTIDGVEATAA